MKQSEIQVLIIGAGSTGLAIARELSRYKIDVMVVEKNVDVCLGEVKASHGLVYSSIGLSAANSLVLKSGAAPDQPLTNLFHPNSLKTRLTAEGFNAFPALAEELDIEFKKTRRVVLGKDQADFNSLEILEKICQAMEVEPERLDQDGVLALEPNVSKEIKRGLSQKGEVVSVYSWEYGIALAENAQSNGVRLMLLNEVLGIKVLPGGFIVHTARGPIKTRFIVNAAGSYADRVAKMAGVGDFGLAYTRSQMLITDKRLRGLVNHTTGMVSRPGSARSVRPTLSGNVQILCTNYYPSTGPGDTATQMKWTDENIAGARELFPSVSKADIITSYVGVRAFNTRDPEEHIIEVSKGNQNFINAVTRLPGLSFTPAMAKYVVGLLGEQGLELVEKTDFNPRRRRIPRVSELPDAERARLIAEDPRYGHIVCRCEEVTEGEIVAAIKRGARTVAGVKYRTRAGMGRCQRGFCGPRVVEILARELDIPLTEVTQMGGLSRVLLYRSKELLGS